VVQPPLVITSSLVSALQRKLTFLSDAITKSPKTVKLASTKDEVVVSIHKELLCFFSSYYSAALNGNFLEAQKDQFEVELSGGDLKSFATWIYTGDLSRSTTRRCSITLYIFADLVDIIALRHKTVSSLARGKLLEYDLANLVHDNLPPKSPLRRYMLDSYIAHWEPIFDDEDTCILEGDTDSDYRPANFTFHVMMGITFRTRKDPPGCTCCHDVCQYHEHLSKEEWQASMLSTTRPASAVYLLSSSLRSTRGLEDAGLVGGTRVGKESEKGYNR
jgi:hypothetical protein